MKIHIDIEIPDEIFRQSNNPVRIYPNKLYPSAAIKDGCTCHEHNPWLATIPPPPCPVHGQAQMMKVWC